ncbi:AzlC family ABC transporter permease, partial [Mitsuokella jalaludinii]
MTESFESALAKTRREVFLEGVHDGMPIALGYFVVSFTLGIAARNAGLDPLQGFLASFFNNASAGEYAGFTVIEADAPYLEIVLITLVANARYMLMSCALSQKFQPGTSIWHRIFVGFDVTDEIF